MSATQLAERLAKIKWERKIWDHQRRALWARQAFSALRPANDLPHPTTHTDPVLVISKMTFNNFPVRKTPSRSLQILQKSIRSLRIFSPSTALTKHPIVC
jgi:hypothetical protein